MRAFRPSRHSPYEKDLDEQTMEDRAKQAKMALYAWRAQVGLPLFDDQASLAVSSRPKK